MTDTTDAMTALSNALLSLTHHDVRPPCGDGSDRWTSDDHDQRASAARLCLTCPLLDVCGRYADAVHPTHGVFGGRIKATGVSS